MKIYIEDNVCTIYKLILHWLEKLLTEQGHTVVDDGNEADICLAGVCAAFNADEERSVKIIDGMKRFGKPIIAYGCMTQINPTKLDVSERIASWDIDKLSGILGVSDATLCLPIDFRAMRDYRVCDTGKKFIGISVGCSFDCSYCPHKLGTGDIVSIHPSKILDSIETANTSGAHTIVLTGTDTACYGSDIGIIFADLLKMILDKLNSKINIHIAQFNPEGLFFGGGEIMNLLGDKRIKDIQLPIQTASQRLLKEMNRNYSIRDVLDMIVHLRMINDSVVLRTDIMVGFPSETMEDLDKTIEFVCREFDEVAVYTFELKKNTPIALSKMTLFSDDIIRERKLYVVDKINKAGLLCHSGGQEVDTLIENDTIKETLRRQNLDEKQG